METFTVYIGSEETLRDGRTQDLTRPVEFVGEELARLTGFGTGQDGRPTDTARGTTETLYRTEDGRLLVHVKQWSCWEGEPNVYHLQEVTAADLEVNGTFEALGRLAGFGRALTVDEALGSQVDVIDDYRTGPAICLGFFQLARPGDAALICRTCGQALAGDIWIEVISNGRGGCYQGGPFCARCASSE